MHFLTLTTTLTSCPLNFSDTTCFYFFLDLTDYISANKQSSTGFNDKMYIRKVFWGLCMKKIFISSTANMHNTDYEKGTLSKNVVLRHQEASWQILFKLYKFLLPNNKKKMLHLFNRVLPILFWQPKIS